MKVNEHARERAEDQIDRIANRLRRLAADIESRKPAIRTVGTLQDPEDELVPIIEVFERVTSDVMACLMNIRLEGMFDVIQTAFQLPPD